MNQDACNGRGILLRKSYTATLFGVVCSDPDKMPHLTLLMPTSFQDSSPSSIKVEGSGFAIQATGGGKQHGEEAKRSEARMLTIQFRTRGSTSGRKANKAHARKIPPPMLLPAIGGSALRGPQQHPVDIKLGGPTATSLPQISSNTKRTFINALK